MFKSEDQKRKRRRDSERGVTIVEYSLLVSLLLVVSLSAIEAMSGSVTDKLCSPATAFDDEIFAHIETLMESGRSFSEFGAVYVPGEGANAGCCLTMNGTVVGGFCTGVQ